MKAQSKCIHRTWSATVSQLSSMDAGFIAVWFNVAKFIAYTMCVTLVNFSSEKAMLYFGARILFQEPGNLISQILGAITV